MFAEQSVRHQILPHADDIAFHVSLHVKVCMLLDVIIGYYYTIVYFLSSQMYAGISQ